MTISKDLKTCVMWDYSASCFTMWPEINGPALHPKTFFISSSDTPGVRVSTSLGMTHHRKAVHFTCALMRLRSFHEARRGYKTLGSVPSRGAWLSFYLGASLMWFTSAAVWPKDLNGTRPLTARHPDLPAPRRAATPEQDAGRATKTSPAGGRWSVMICLLV